MDVQEWLTRMWKQGKLSYKFTISDGEELKDMQSENERLREAFDKHRAKSMICCDETCFCWEAEYILERDK